MQTRVQYYRLNRICNYVLPLIEEYKFYIIICGMFLFFVITWWLFLCFASASCAFNFFHSFGFKASDMAKYVIGDPPVTNTTPELIANDGFLVEIHEVTTSDGYILELHRIPGSQGADGSRGPIAFLQHGLLCDSAIFVITGTNNALAYLLADRGYDVWLGNSRGNRYSRRHIRLSPDAKDGLFWQFSWHEMGVYDLPAIIDYILLVTKMPDLIYIGHSQGTTQFFVMGSERPDYNRKIKAMFAMSPIVYFRHARSPIFRAPLNMALHSLVSYHELFNIDSVLSRSIKRYCMANITMNNIACAKSMFIMAGYDLEQLDLTMIPKLFSVFPSSAASLQMAHFEQVYKTEKFQQFDFGNTANLRKYGSPNPPTYNLGRVTAPVTLYYGRNDLLCAEEDVDTLYSELGNPRGKFELSLATFNHFDFIVARDVKTLLYDHLVLNMEKKSGLR